jgi:hypothetical protein
LSDINFLYGIPLGKIKRWQGAKQSGIIPIPLPTQDAGEAEAIDGIGVIYTVRIVGQMVGDFLTLQNNIYAINNIIDGFQNSAVPLYSPHINSSTTGLVSKIKRCGHYGINTSVTTNRLVDSGTDFSQLGTRATDIVKNLVTGATAVVTSAALNHLNLSANIFPNPGTPYAVTAYINVKLISFDHTYEIPGQRWVDYTLEVIQVKQ